MNLGGLGGLTVHSLLNRIDECLLPDDREPLLDYLEMLEKKIGGILTKNTSTIHFNTANGTQCLVKIMKKMINDEVTLRFALNIFDLQKRNVPIMIDFLRFGGLEILNEMLEKHSEDIFLMGQLPKFKKSLLAIGGNQAIREIEHEGVALQLCQACQETVERARRLHSVATTNAKFPKASERVNRVVLFMESYPDKATVIQAGLDALIYFARNSDSKNAIDETTMISCICKLLPNFKSNADVVWRVFLCLHQSCSSKMDIAMELIRYNIHELMVEIYPMHTDPRIQQQIVWLLDIFVTFPRTITRIHISSTCMTWIGKLIETRDQLIATVGTSVKDKYLPYKIVIPLKIKQFYRDTGGKVLEVAPENEARKTVIAMRKKFLPAPKYGTSTQVYFSEGEKGLVDD